MNIYLSHEDFNDLSLRDFLTRTHANAITPLSRVQHEVVFRYEAKLDPGEAMVICDPIYGMGPKLSKLHNESVRTLISSKRRGDAAKAKPEAARVLDRLRKPNGEA